MAEINSTRIYRDSFNQSAFDEGSLAEKSRLAIDLFRKFLKMAKSNYEIDSFILEEVPNNPSFIHEQRLRISGVHSALRAENNGIYSRGTFETMARKQNIILAHSGNPSPHRDFQVNFKIDEEDEKLMIFSRSMSPELAYYKKGTKAYWFDVQPSDLEADQLRNTNLEDVFTGFASSVKSSVAALNERAEAIRTYLDRGNYAHVKRNLYVDTHPMV